MESRTNRPCRNRRLPAAVLMGGFAGISLLTFPAHLMFMVAAWLIVHGLVVRAGRPGWMPLLACVAIVLIKGSAWLPAVVLLLAVLAGVGMFRLAGHLAGRIPPASATNILVEIPRGIVIDRFGGLERRLARRYDLELVSDSVLRECILLGPCAPPGMWLSAQWHLSDDGLHPNARGNKRLARQVCHAMQRIYGPQIRR